MKGLVSHWMTKVLVNAGPDDPVFDALEVMADLRVRHVLVIDEHERLQGIVSNRDIIRSAMRNPDKQLQFFGCSLREIMTPMPLFITSSNATLEEVATLMHEHKVSALPVIDGGELRGLITSDDVLAAVSNSCTGPTCNEAAA